MKQHKEGEPEWPDSSSLTRSPTKNLQTHPVCSVWLKRFVDIHIALSPYWHLSFKLSRSRTLIVASSPTWLAIACDEPVRILLDSSYSVSPWIPWCIPKLMVFYSVVRMSLWSQLFCLSNGWSQTFLPCILWPLTPIVPCPIVRSLIGCCTLTCGAIVRTAVN